MLRSPPRWIRKMGPRQIGAYTEAPRRAGDSKSSIFEDRVHPRAPRRWGRYFVGRTLPNIAASLFVLPFFSSARFRALPSFCVFLLRWLSEILVFDATTWAYSGAPRSGQQDQLAGSGGRALEPIACPAEDASMRVHAAQ